MADTLKEEGQAKHIYASLQRLSCPLVDGLYLQEADSMLQLLCTPSQLRTDILTWICSSINPNFAALKEKKLKDPDILTKEMATLGQELMLCKEDNLGLIRGDASPCEQLHFLQQLLSVVPGCRSSAEACTAEEILLNKLFAAENLPHLRELLTPTFDPWPANIKALHKASKPALHKPRRSDASDVAALLQSTRSVLEQLQSECEFLTNEAPSPGAYSPTVLHVAARDLQQLTATFCHVYESDLRTCCKRDPPSFSTDTEIFQRVHDLLLACNTELELLNEVSEACVCVREDANQLQTQPRYWSHGEKRTLPDKLEELTRRYRDFVARLHP
ncbi:HAUS augmin-like complex subunit 7 [Aulostomus maculatus]